MNNKRKEAEINSSSLADIAFLLLMFFLVTTTINVDKGIGLTLPPLEVDQQAVNSRNMLIVLVNEQGDLQLNGVVKSIEEIKDDVVEFVDNNGVEPHLSESPYKAIVILKTQRNASYKIYIDALDEVKAAYVELRNNASLEKYGELYSNLEEGSERHEFVKSLYPQKISLGEPDDQ